MRRYRQNYLLLTASSAAVLVGSVAHAQAPAPAPAEEAALEGIVVTGSRLTAGFNAPTPVTVVGAQTVQSRAAATVGEALLQMPAFRNTESPGTSVQGITSGGQIRLDLRGLGLVRTLTLVEGRRHVPGFSNGLFDTNMLPTSLIERVEVVTGGASAAYGSDAVAGVVNFVLNKNLQGLTGSAQYGVSQRNDGKEPNFSLGYGARFAGGRGHFMIGGDYLDQSGVGNMYTRKWGRLEPGLLALPANRAAGLPSQIFANHVQVANRTYGGIINSGPLAGTAFDANGLPYPFQYGSPRGAQEMVGGGNYGEHEYLKQQISQKYDRAALLARVDYDITPDVSAFAQYHYGRVTIDAETLFVPVNPNFVIHRDNPFVPAATRAAMIANNLTTITVNKTGGEWGNLRGGNETWTWQADFGLQGKFRDWRWDIAGTVGRTDYWIDQPVTPRFADLHQSTHATLNANGQIVCGTPQTNPFFLSQPANIRAELLSQVTPTGCVPFNPFGVGTASPQSVAYFASASQQDNESRQKTLQANLAGEPFSLPAGPVSMAVGVEWRKDKFDAVGCPDCLAKKLVNQNYASFSASVTVKEAYAEVGLPLVKDVTFIRALDLNGAIRQTDYSTTGGATTWKVGGSWEPMEDLRFRLTRSRDIRAPNIQELFDPGSNGKANVTNPLNGISGQVDNQTSGNPNLTPEIADTFTAGVVLQPTWEWSSGLRIAVDYYKIKVKNIVGSVQPQDVVNRCYLQRLQEYCSYLTMDGSGLGFNYVRAIRLNLDRLETSGIDIELAYKVPISSIGIPGNLDFRALGTHYRSIKSFQTLPNGTINQVELAGANNTVGAVGGLPKWQWTTRLDYAVGRANIGLQAKYTSKLKYSTLYIGPDDPTYSPTLNNSINKNVWPETLYFSLNGSYDIVREGGRRLQVFGVIDNLLDKDPPIAAFTFMGGSPYNLIGRYFKAGVRFNY